MSRKIHFEDWDYGPVESAEPIEEAGNNPFGAIIEVPDELWERWLAIEAERESILATFRSQAKLFWDARRDDRLPEPPEEPEEPEPNVKQFTVTKEQLFSQGQSQPDKRSGEQEEGS